MKKLTSCDSCGGSLKMVGKNYIKCNYCGQICAIENNGEWRVLTADEIYQKAMSLQQTNDIESSYAAADMFESLGEYNDSNIKAVACLDNAERMEAEEEQRLAEMRAAEEAQRLAEMRKAEEEKRLEEERKAEEEKRLAEERKAEEERRLAQMRQEEEERLERLEERKRRNRQIKKNITRFCMAALGTAACAGIIYFIVTSYQTAQRENYAAALALYEEGNYEEALKTFDKVGSYNDAEEYVSKIEKTMADYAAAFAMYEEGNYDEALEKFILLGTYKDSAEYVTNLETIMAESQVTYDEAYVLYEAKKYEQALEKFLSIKFYDDSEACIDTIIAEILSIANSDFEKNEFERAESMIALIPEECEQYADGVALKEKIENARQDASREAALLADYNEAVNLYNAGNNVGAQSMFFDLGEYRDSKSYLKLIGNNIYDQAKALYDAGEWVRCTEQTQYIDESSEWADYQRTSELIADAKQGYMNRAKEDSLVVLREQGYSAFKSYVETTVGDLFTSDEARFFVDSCKPLALTDIAPFSDSGHVNVDAIYRAESNAEGVSVYTDNFGNTYEYGMNRMVPNFATGEYDSSIKYYIQAYNYLNGTLILNEAYAEEGSAGRLVVYGDEQVIYTSPDVKAGFEPLYISVDVSDYYVVRIEFVGSYENVSLVEPCLYK